MFYDYEMLLFISTSISCLNYGPYIWHQQLSFGYNFITSLFSIFFLETCTVCRFTVSHEQHHFLKLNFYNF